VTLWPILLTLPNGTRRRGAVRADDWEAAELIAQRHYPGAQVSHDTIDSPNTAPVAAALRA
jgi:hypothetical protein